MRLCSWCQQPMIDSCTTRFFFIKGVQFDRDCSHYDDDPSGHCHDCGILNVPGNYHHPGCDVEKCPKCGGQAIGCGCDDWSCEECGESWDGDGTANHPRFCKTCVHEGHVDDTESGAEGE